MAILISEAMTKLDKNINVQIFATDIDTTAIEVARKGVYPAGIAESVSGERLSRFFVREDGLFKIKKQIRDMVVFSVQNVIKDPPFSRLDMVTCRNLMILSGRNPSEKNNSGISLHIESRRGAACWGPRRVYRRIQGSVRTGIDSANGRSINRTRRYVERHWRL